MLCMVGDSKPYIINDHRFVSMILQCNWNIRTSNEKQNSEESIEHICQ